MDIIVTPSGPTSWALTDLLGRNMGRVELAALDEYRIIPGDRVAESMRAMKHGPFATLDAALSQIEVFTRSTCRLAPAAD